MTSAAGHQHIHQYSNANASNMTSWQPRPEAESLHIILLTHSYGKENRREHCRRFARLDFGRSCLLMTSRNTVVYRYHGIFEMVYYCRAFPSTASLFATAYLSGDNTCSSDIYTHVWRWWTSRLWRRCSVWNCDMVDWHWLSGVAVSRHSSSVWCRVIPAASLRASWLAIKNSTTDGHIFCTLLITERYVSVHLRNKIY